MASEVIKLNIIPTGEMPVFHCSQFDNGRLINIELYRGEDAYTIPEGCTAELHCRKVDGNIVTIGSPVVDENTIKFTSTTQLTACNGKNLCEVAILGADDYLIGSLNFWLEVELDPLKGGINSTSEIHDLYEQVEEITTEVIGDDYYNKTQVDDLLDAKADTSSVYTKTETDAKLALKANASSVYTKSETDTLLLTKADASDVYTKGQVDTKLAAKADAADVYTKDETDTLLEAKANANGVYSKVEVDAIVDDLEDAIDLKADQSTTYTKTEVDTALALKANATDVYTKAQVDSALALKANAADVYTKSEVYNKTETYSQAQVDALIDGIFPTFTASGDIASFTTALTKPLVSVTAAAGATTVTRCGINVAELSENTNYDSSECTYVYENNGVNITALNRYARASWHFKVKVGQTYTVSFYGYGTANFLNVYYNNTIAWGDSYGRSVLSGTRTKYTKTITANSEDLFIGFYATNTGTTGDMVIEDFMLEVGSSASDIYSPYNGQTVPVADATTLTTLSGLNNVFTDSGEVTVQYKYMSM